MWRPLSAEQVKPIWTTDETARSTAKKQRKAGREVAQQIPAFVSFVPASQVLIEDGSEPEMVIRPWFPAGTQVWGCHLE